MTDHPSVHALLYGDPGAGKSTGAATFPKPMLVFMWDPRGKETPYLKRGGEVELGENAEDGTPWQSIKSKTDPTREIIRLEHYHDWDPAHPTAYSRFLVRLTRLQTDVAAYRTIVLDSVTFMELAARKMHQYVLNPTSKEPRQWFAGSTDALEEVLMIRFGALACNVVVTAHIDEDKDEVHGTMVRNPSAPGRLRKRSPAGYSELYRAFVRRDPKTGPTYLWQTRSDAIYNCASQIEAPELVVQDYAALWTPVP
jgi:hypothetical protein